MVQRLIAVGIIAFWSVMMTLLVRLELYPERSPLASIPVSVVTKLMFHHAQTSDLNIYENGQPVGRFSLHPKTIDDGRHRSLDFAGGMHLRVPMMPRQRLQLEGVMELDRASKIVSLRLNLAVREPGYRLLVNLPRGGKAVHYELKQGEEIVQSSSLNPDTATTNEMLKGLGLDPQTTQRLRQSVSAPVITAKRSELQIRSDKVLAYLLTIKQGEAVIANVYVSQLGQILKATTAIGYTLAPADAFP